jgi:hypothetical protein
MARMFISFVPHSMIAEFAAFPASSAENHAFQKTGDDARAKPWESDRRQSAAVHSGRLSARHWLRRGYGSEPAGSGAK